MEQFSHDLTLALEETSRVRAGHCWGVRRRTRSTGNLPCAPQPTEDSSSSPADGPNEVDCPNNSILSDSDDRQDFKLALRARQPSLFGNFESDSLNENFSPTRPNTRRKRKFKRMAVEYETTPSTPGNPNPCPMFPIAGNSTVKKRVMKHTSQENFRANLFFCGKRKRSHRDRYHDHEHYRLHSSSVPRQRDLFAPKSSYYEYKNRNRGSYNKPCERILPLNKNIVSKIEKISQDSSASRLLHSKMPGSTSGIVGYPFNSSCLAERNFRPDSNEIRIPGDVFKPQVQLEPHPISERSVPAETIPSQSKPTAQKSGSFESTFCVQEFSNVFPSRVFVDSVPVALASVVKPIATKTVKDHPTLQRKLHGQVSAKPKHSKRLNMKKMQLQFDDPNGMDCATLNDFLSSSSLSSSDSEAAETNESDREGDDELTDWPGNEAMVNFASKNDFKRAKPPRNNSKSTLPLIKGGAEDFLGQDDDTLMSADEVLVSPNAAMLATSSQFVGPALPTAIFTASSSPLPPNSLNLTIKYTPAAGPMLSTATTNQLTQSTPIDIVGSTSGAPLPGQEGFIESEMSGETSNHFLSSSSPCIEVREFRAGCRRVRDERPGFTIFTSVNEHLSRFLQDSRQTQLMLPYTDHEEHAKLLELAKLYSLTMQVENGRAILSKTINTTQSVKIGQSNISTRFLSDYKRRCYGAAGNDDDSESTEMAS